jgi:peptide/nickel transport system substrate-binding protein
VWQATLALLGIALVFLILFQLAASQAPAEPELETTEAPATGGTFIEGMLGFSGAINPILAPSMIQANPADQDLNSLVFDGLTSLDATGQVSPSLALNWEVSEDGSAFTFHLRQDVTWHDGAPLTATDVAFTVQAMQDPDYQGDPTLQELWRTVRVDQLDEYTIRFVLEEPFPSFLLYTTVGLLPAHLLSNVAAIDLPEHDFSKENPIGTGQFMVQSVSPDRVVLIANPNYWGPRPYLDAVEFWFYGDWGGLLADYEQGGIHALHPSNPEELSTLVAMPDLQLYSAQLAGYGIVFLNLRRDSLPFFQTKEVRQALLYALDRQLLIDQAINGQGLVADSPMVPSSWAFSPAVRTYGYDPIRAIGLLDASGWMDSDADRIRDKDDVELSFTLLTSDDPAMVQMAEELARQWSAVGIDTRIQSVGGETLSDLVRGRDFDAALIQVGLTADPDPYPLWHSTQTETGQNVSGFSSEEADLVMEEARLTADPERSLELYHSFQNIFAEEVPSLLLYYPIYTYAVDARVKGVQLSPLFHTSDRFRNIEEWYMETGEIIVSPEQELDKSQD